MKKRNYTRSMIVIILLIILGAGLSTQLAQASFAAPGRKPTRTPITNKSATPTRTIQPTATLTRTNQPTATPSQTPSRTNTATFTATPTVPSMSSSTPTVTATPTALHTPTGTATGGPRVPKVTTFSIGRGGVDVIPHQIVRTGTDRLYTFNVETNYTFSLSAHWTGAAGLPTIAANFTGYLVLADTAQINSIDAVYDGSQTIHVLTNLNNGQIKDHPFNTATNTFAPAHILATNGATVAGEYGGSSGITGMVDTSGVLHVAYWSNGEHILYTAFTYQPETNNLTPLGSSAQIDGDGHSNHPVLAISPLDGSITIAWIRDTGSGTNWAANILVRTLTSSGWSAIQTVSTAEAWASRNFGVNIDQGPSLLIKADGTIHLAYIEDWRMTIPYDYGRVHYVTNASGAWVDSYTGIYSHDPALAINSYGEMYFIGHGYPLNTACNHEGDMCLFQRQSNGAWAYRSIIAPQNGSIIFDSSPSVKWSLVGNNRPETIEFLFADVGTNYSVLTLYYGRVE